MRILHYNLGLPPYRTGGLTKYAIDLAVEQQEEGEEVSILFPGNSTFSKKNKVKFYKKYKGIKVYEVLNPLPVPLLKGIKNPSDFMKLGNFQNYLEFLKSIRPEVIHVHTLMGLHKEFIEAAKKLNIRVVYTTHDYFGICPKVNLVDYKQENCFNYNNGEKCCICNEYAPSTKKIKIGTSLIYREIRMKFLTPNFKKKLKKIKKLRDKKIKINVDETIVQENKISKFEDSYKFRQLRKYHIDMLNKMDFIHYNSNISKMIFENYVDNKNNDVIFITHKDIFKAPDFKKQKSEKIRLSFLGTDHLIKGLPILLKAFKELEPEIRKKYLLNIYGVEGVDEKDIKFHGEYKHSELSKIFSETDWTIIPSTWYETFNFVALESKVYDTPVIISNTIGAKDIFGNNEKIEINSDVIEIQNILKKLKKTNCLTQKDFLFNNHIKKIKNKYYWS